MMPLDCRLDGIVASEHRYGCLSASNNCQILPLYMFLNLSMYISVM